MSVEKGADYTIGPVGGASSCMNGIIYQFRISPVSATSTQMHMYITDCRGCTASSPAERKQIKRVANKHHPRCLINAFSCGVMEELTPVQAGTKAGKPTGLSPRNQVLLKAHGGHRNKQLSWTGK